MADRFRIVSVRTGKEVTHAELRDGVVHYAEHDRGVAKTVIEQRMRDADLGLVDAFAAVKRDGWSNGYLMVDIENLKPTT